MTGSDVAALTAGYLSQLPPAVRQAAEAHTETAHWMAVLDLVVVVIACWLMLRLDLLGRLSARMAALGARPRTIVPVCSAGLAAGLLGLMALAGLAMGVKPDGYGLAFAGAVIVASIVYAAIRAAPRLWWVWGGGVFVGLAVLVVWVPFALASGPADLPPVPPGPMREALLDVVRKTGLQTAEIYLSDKPGIDADVTGTPGRPRVAVSRDFVARQTATEARAELGHLTSHYAHQDQLTLALTVGLLGLALLFAVDRLFAPLARMLGRGDLRLADPAGLPIAAIIAVVGIAGAGVGYNNVVRLINVRADQYSLDHAREPDGLAEALLASDRTDRVDPSAFEEAVFYNHPALANRIAQAMRWKLEHAAGGPALSAAPAG